MAHAALISLKQTIERLLNSYPNPCFLPSPEIIQLAYEEIKSLQKLLTSEDGNNNRVKASEREIREAAGSLEDVLESAHVSYQNFLSQPEVKEDIDLFTEKVKKINEQLSNSLLLEEDDDAVSSRIDQYFGLKEQKIIGLARDLNNFSQLVLGNYGRDREYLGVISVVGMAGIGKTTFVSGVYLDPHVVSHFECRAFVSIGTRKYQLRKILLCIINQIDSGFDTSRDAEINDDEELASYLYSCLKNRRYLIVVDDIWNMEDWDELKRAFPDDINQSRVIVISRLRQIAYHVNPSYLHEMRFLDKEESWHLLREKVFGGEENSCPPELEKAGKKIAEMCEGLPLAIIAVAKHLSQAKKTVEYWEKVAEKDHSVIMAGDEEMSKVLSVSYHHLPQFLKACFLYTGTFPHDSKIRASKLIKLWCAERFLELDFMLEDLEDFARGHRRLCIHNNALFGIKDVNELMASISNTRSLLCTGPHHQYPVPICLGSFSLLRVLNALTIRFYVFPDEVVKLVKLRYLAFTYNGKLHASISKLQNLQLQVAVPTPPRATIFPSDVRKLTLSGFEFPWEYMSSIGQLPNLEILKLQCCAFQGQHWTTYEGEFSKLKFLLLEGIDLRYWTAHHPDCFKYVERLIIRHCYKLERIPPGVGSRPYNYVQIQLVDCNPCLVAYAKEEMLGKTDPAVKIYVESSADGVCQSMANHRSFWE
ncbi:putative late blight resistance proteinR1A-4 [Sesamum alatum]|uniref:Late blight resistance proteinR1A-4 n=1 Tax=Sesamum alatum TaxID=300844 RepID=A0AAE1YWJ3_9LAMI|nr:putative late blight resistance proteinR1A-4 [Sesamum alatum]